MARYGRASEPIIEDGKGVHPLEALIGMREQAQEHGGGILRAMDPAAQLQQVAFIGRRKMSVGERLLLFFYFHDTCHTNQTELLRQATRPKNAAIWRRRSLMVLVAFVAHQSPAPPSDMR